MTSLLRKAAVAAASFTLLSLALASATSAQAAAATPSPEATSSSVTWSVRPGDASGPDGRSWIEWEGDPGESRTEYLVVDNHGDDAVEFRLSAADGYFTDTGRFNMLPSDRESVDAGTWISLADAVEVPPRGSTVVPLEISIPADATPGDHPAGVAASIHSPGTSTVGVESRVGFRVMTRVTGELRTTATATVSGSFTTSINPFQSGDLDVTYEITNTGNTRLRTQPVVSVTGPMGATAVEQDGEEIAEIAPGETRRATIRVSPAWPLGWYDVQVTALPTAVSDEVALGAVEAATAHATVAAVPLPQLATLAVAGLLLAWYLAQRRRTQRRTARLVEAARAEGRAEAPAAPLAQSDADTSAGEPAAKSTEPATPAPLRRRDLRPSARVLVGVALAASAVTGIVGAGSSEAVAATGNDSGVEVRVEISPIPSPPAPTGAPSPSGTANPSPAETPAVPPLPATGAEFDLTLPVAGAALLAGGAALALALRRRTAGR